MTVANPYYADAPAALFDRNGLLLAVHDPVEPVPGRGRLQHAQRPHGARQYKRGQVTLTPSVTYTSGSFYGSPLVWPGYDPRTCTATVAGSSKADTTSCSQGATPLFIPDPYTGHFDQQGRLNSSRG